MGLSQYQQRLVEIVQENPECIDEIALDSLRKDFAGDIEKDPTTLPLVYCRSFGARGFVAFLRLAFKKFIDSELYLSVQKINREFNPENNEIKKRLIGLWNISSPYFREVIGDFNSYLTSCNKKEFNSFKPFSCVDLRLWLGIPKYIQSEGSHCDWTCNDNGLVQAPQVPDKSLDEIVIPNLVLQEIMSHSGLYYEDKHKTYPKNVEFYYNESMRLCKILDVK